MGIHYRFVCQVLLLLLCVAPASAEPEVERGVAIKLSLEPLFSTIALQRPLALLASPLSEQVFYILEQAGRIRRVARHQGRDESRVFADLRARVESGPNEAGLLGMAFDPAFANNGRVYVSYTREGSPLVSILSRWQSRDNGQTLDLSSEQVLLSVPQPYGNHNGGDIHFGPDNLLYYGLGDGGAAGDPEQNGQNTRTLLGSLLRLDVSGDNGYKIPPSNPFAQGGGRPEIFAYGLRNPWRWSFDRQTGDLWLGDVGQNRWEEVNRIVAGGNYGWNLREGRHCYSGDCRRSGLIEPLAEYSHAEGCSITGGYVYRGKNIPALVGVYLFADYCSGNIWGLFADSSTSQGQTTYTRRLLVHTDLNISSFGEDRQGEIYIIDLGGRIFRLAKGSIR
jgi:glucose/arabinose dehydrogenase